jgi:hypothetical protein
VGCPIDAWSWVQLSVEGEYSTTTRPRYEVQITAPNRSSVSHEQVMVGRDERYSVFERVENRNDSPAFARIVLREAS